MADQFFDKFSDLKSLKSEQGKVITLLDQISARMKALQDQGIRISFAGSIKDINQAIKDLDATTRELSALRKEYAVTSSKVIQSKQRETQATKELSKAEADAVVAGRERKKDAILEANLRKAAANSIDEYSARIAILQRNLTKLDTTKEEDLIIQDSINKQIEKYNALILAQQTGIKKPTTGTTVAPQTPVNPVLTTNLADIEKENELLAKTGVLVNDIDLANREAEQSAIEWAAAQKEAAGAGTGTGAGAGIAGAASASGLKEASGAAVVYKDELEKLTGTLVENEAALNAYKVELATVQVEIKDLNAATTAAERNSPKYQARLQQLLTTESLLKGQVKELNYVVKQQTIENNADAGSVEKLTARYNLLILQISKLSAIQRKSPQGQTLVTEARALDIQIANVQKKTGQLSSSANNMSNAVTRSLGRFVGYLRNIAYLIPGIGIGGLIGLVIEPILNLFDRTDKEAEELNKKMKDLIKTGSEIKEVGEFSNQGDIALVQTLTAVVNDQTRSYKDRNAALNQLKEINKVYFGDMTIEKANLGLLTVATKDYTDALIASSVVKAFGDQIGKVSVEFAEQTNILNKANAEAQKYRNKINEIVEPYEELVKASKSFNKETGHIEGYRNLRDAVLAVLPDDQVEKVLKYQKALDKSEHTAYLAGGAYLELAHNIKELKDNFKDAVDESLKFKPLTAPKGGEDVQKRIKEYGDALKKLRDLYLEISNDEQRSIQDRGEARAEAFLIDVDLIEQKRKIEIANAKGSAYDIAQINADADAAIIDGRRKKNDFILKLEAQFNAKLVENAQKSRDLAKDFPQAINDQLRSLYEERGKIAQDDNDLELIQLDNAYKEQQLVNEKNFNTGKISKRKFESEQLKIQKEFEIKSLQSTIDNALKQLQVERELANLEKDPVKKDDRLRAIKEAEEKITGLLTQLNILRFAKTKEANKKIADDFAETFKAISEAAKASFEIIGGFIHARSEAEKNALQEQIDLLEEKRQKDIDAADQTIQDAQLRADEIIRINAKADAEKTRLETKQRQAQERDARFQKASTIASIIQETALAVVRALGAKPYTPANIALAAITGALGAAQLAVAIATPIPKYAKGGTLEKTKTIEVAEQGRELSVSPDGKLTLYEKPTITTLAGGTKILSNKVTEDVLRSRKGVHTLSAPVKESVVLDRTDEVLTELKAIKKRVKLVVINTVPIETTPYYLENLKGK